MIKRHKKLYITLGILVILIAGVVYWSVGRKPAVPDYQTATAKIMDLVHEVSVTGRVEPIKKVEMAFERSGRIVAVHADVGDHVTQGQNIVRLDIEGLVADRNEVEASLRAEEAKLNELKKGTRSEEVLIQEARVAGAEVSVSEAEKSLFNTFQDSYTKSDDAIRNKADQFFTNPRTASPNLNFVTDVQIESNIESERVMIENLLVLWKSMLNALSVSGDLHVFSITTRNNLDTIKSFLDDVAFALNGAPRPDGVAQTTFDGWKSDIATARTTLNTAITNLSAAEEALNSSETNLTVVKNELELKKAGSTEEAITAQEAKVDSVRAQIDSINVSITNSVLRAPVNGVVTTQDAKVGEIAAANKILVTLIGDSGFQLKAYVPEADIANVTIGDKATLTLDAYGSDIEFAASVVSIDPAETVLEGVATYRVVLILDTKDDRVKPGMTANIIITTDRRAQVLAIPLRAIVRKGTKKFVRIPDGDSYEEVEVEIGLRGSDGNIEIKSGLSEGAQVITFIQE